MDGITAIHQRMAEIQATIDRFAPTAAPAGTSPTAAAFDQVLTKAVAATAPASTARNADGVPVELARYGNGKIPASALGEVGSTGHRLWAPAADALQTMRDAAARDGVSIGITDSYRSYDAQVRVAKEKGLYSQGGLAAAPGTSPHGWGLAADLKLDAAGQAWMRANGSRFGFAEDTPREPWHWVYQG